MRIPGFVLALAGLGCAAPHATDGSGPAAAARVRYLALGDSFTIGTGADPRQSFPARLSARWTCPFELLNAAVDGFTTDDVIAVELPDLETFAPTVVTLLVGANDIVHGERAERYRAHLRVIFESIRAAGVSQVVALPQPDWSASPVANLFGSPATLHARILQFNGILRDEAAAAHAEFVDLFPLMEKQAAEKMIAGDGLHPSALAYDAWGAELSRRVVSPCDGSP